jgi:hypothetical protein
MIGSGALRTTRPTLFCDLFDEGVESGSDPGLVGFVGDCFFDVWDGGFLNACDNSF